MLRYCTMFQVLLLKKSRIEHTKLKSNEKYNISRSALHVCAFFNLKLFASLVLIFFQSTMINGNHIYIQQNKP